MLIGRILLFTVQAVICVVFGKALVLQVWYGTEWLTGVTVQNDEMTLGFVLIGMAYWIYYTYVPSRPDQKNKRTLDTRTD
jgi:hypothetical protein